MNRIFLLLLLLPISSRAQFQVNLTSDRQPLYPTDGDTISLCRDTLITFRAEVTDGGATVDSVDCFWDFGDGNTRSGLDLLNIKHTYLTDLALKYKGGGFFRVKLKVSKHGKEAYALIPLRVDVPPSFAKSDNGIDSDKKGICKGSSTTLTGRITSTIYRDSFIFQKKETPPEEINSAKNYQKHLSFNEFAPGAKYASGNIDSIGIEILHPDADDLKITLSCQSGKKILLKSFASDKHLPAGDTAQKQAFFFYWKTTATSEMNDTNILHNESSFLPEENFDGLIGCKLNEKWSINIEDNDLQDSGLIYSWAIYFNDLVRPRPITFRDTIREYVKRDGVFLGSTYWEGTQVASQITQTGDLTTVMSSATPEVYGNTGYTLHTINNRGCPADTIITVNVERPHFSATPESGNAKLDVDFENFTRWAVDREWSFGDGTPKELVVDADKTSHTYLTKGLYQAVLKLTDKNGCIDYDTLLIRVSVEPSKMEDIPNTFTPNGDGINDVYKFQEEKLQGMREFSLTIYNRWGNKMYKTKSQEEAINEGWDGSVSPFGGKASPGTYFYIIKAKGKDGKEYNEKGCIHLFR